MHLPSGPKDDVLAGDCPHILVPRHGRRTWHSVHLAKLNSSDAGQDEGRDLVFEMLRARDVGTTEPACVGDLSFAADADTEGAAGCRIPLQGDLTVRIGTDVDLRIKDRKKHQESSCPEVGHWIDGCGSVAVPVLLCPLLVQIRQMAECSAVPVPVGCNPNARVLDVRTLPRDALLDELRIATGAGQLLNR